jgi:DNA gyrase subunit A
MATRDEDFVSSVYVVNTHTPVLFFSSRGMVYKLKVYKLPLGTPQARGKALVNLLPLDEGETITTLMPLPEDESACGELDVMFTTASGSVRRNRLSDFVNVMANGKIAMKLNDGDHLVGVSVCDSNQDILLSTAKGKCIRFPTTDVRLFAGRASSGVRGIKLAAGDNVMSMSTLNHASFSIEERNAYLRRRRAERMDNDDDAETNGNQNNNGTEAVVLSNERYAEMVEMDQFILTLAANGYGKRTSSYEYTVRKRGGQGIANIDLSVKDNTVVASFPVMDQDQLVLVTDNGQMIRTGINEIRIAGRSTRGVIVFRVADKEHVVSVSRLPEVENDEENDDNEITDEIKSASTSDSEIEESASPNDKIQTDGEENV